PNDRDAQAKALLADMGAMEARQQATAARELNQEMSGFRSLFLNTARKAADIEPTAKGLTAFDPRWADDKFWKTIEANATALTMRHYQQVTGIVVDADGRLS